MEEVKVTVEWTRYPDRTRTYTVDADTDEEALRNAAFEAANEDEEDDGNDLITGILYDRATGYEADDNDGELDYLPPREHDKQAFGRVVPDESTESE